MTDTLPALDAVRAAIDEANARYARAIETHDDATLREIFEVDGTIIDPEGGDAVGHEGLKAMVDQARDQMDRIEFRIETRWVRLDPLQPAYAYAFGDWRFAFTPTGGLRAGQHLRAHGEFVEIWRAGDDGRWRLFRDLTVSRIHDSS